MASAGSSESLLPSSRGFPKMQDVRRAMQKRCQSDAKAMQSHGGCVRDTWELPGDMQIFP